MASRSERILLSQELDKADELLRRASKFTEERGEAGL